MARENSESLDHSHQVKLFSNELHMLVNDELALVQSDVARVKTIVNESMRLLEGSFFSIQNETNEQFRMLNMGDKLSLQENAQSSLGGAEGIDLKEAVVDKYKSICKELNEAMRALQSEDIVGQLSDRISEHVGDIRQAVDILSDLHALDAVPQSHYLSESHNQYQALKERLANGTARNIVSQENLDEGDVDLF